MARRSDQSVQDILADAENMPPTEEPEDDELLDTAEPVEIPRGNALDVVSLDELETLPTLHDAREEANIPDHVGVKDLVGIPIVIARKTAQKAALPETGEMRDGFFCDVINVDTKKPLTVWIGQIALLRDLQALPLPFRCMILKQGRTYRFV